ncbi:hypothetical protein ARMGADRAFT_1084879 [Armillaria gallica]|uniref:Uncharacterized protein n=1 Tax=Armillaria gallica TaxID=47427 RepID=A0A2H3CZ11_ARMGA|nr:hypothetical protein ARMGADRAFT_1084879 [Armillaria gallica]
MREIHNTLVEDQSLLSPVKLFWLQQISSPNVNFVAGLWFNPNDAPSPPVPWKSQSVPDTEQVVAPFDIFPDYTQELGLFGDTVPFLSHRQHQRLHKSRREACPKTNNVRVHPYTKHPPKPREEVHFETSLAHESAREHIPTKVLTKILG